MDFDRSAIISRLTVQLWLHLLYVVYFTLGPFCFILITLQYLYKYTLSSGKLQINPPDIRADNNLLL